MSKPFGAILLSALPLQAFADSAPPSPPANRPIPSARVELAKGWGAHFFGDLLYWKANEEGLYYAFPSLNNTANPPFPQNDIFKGVNGKVKRVKPDYAFGFKVGTKINLPWDEWDLSLIWTSYRNRENSRIYATPPFTLSPFWLNNNFNPMAQGAHAHWKLTFDSLDLNIGRAFYAGKFLSLRPFAGLKAGWIHQHLNVKYKEVTLSNSQFTPLIKSKNSDNSSGYGLLGGLETNWKLGWGFSIEGNGSAALLWTDHEIDQFEFAPPNINRSETKQNVSRIAAMFDLFAGLKWERACFSERIYFAFHAGWEEQVWVAQNQLNRFIGNAENLGAMVAVKGDLTFSGLTAGAALRF